MGLIASELNISSIQLKESAAPSSPAAGYARLYLGTDEKLHLLTDDPLDKVLGGGLGSAQDSPTELTIASGVITATQGFHRIDTEADAGSDDLDTINGLTANALYLFRAENAARTVVFKHGTGNIVSPTSSDIQLTDIATGVLGWYDGTNFNLLTASRPNDVQAWGSYPDDSINIPVTDNSSGEMFSITGDEIQLWRTYQQTGAQSITTVPNLHLLLDSATAFLTTVTGTPLAGSAWVIQVLTAPGAGSHTVKLPAGCTWDGTNNTAAFDNTADFLEGKWISATRFLLKPTTTGVVYSIT